MQAENSGALSSELHELQRSSGETSRTVVASLAGPTCDELLKAREALALLQAAHEDLQMQQQRRGTELAAAQQEKVVQEHAATQLRKTVADLEARLAITDEDLQQAHTVQRQQQQEIERMADAVETLQSRQAVLETEAQDACAALARATRALSDHQHLQRDADAAAAAAKSELAETHARCSELEQQCSNGRDELARHNRATTAARAALQDLLDATLQQLEAAERANANLQQHEESLQQALLEAQVMAAQQAQQAQQKEAAYLVEIDSLTLSVSDLRAELTELEMIVDAKQEVAVSTQARCAELETTVAAQQATIVQLSEAIASKAGEQAAQAQDLAELSQLRAAHQQYLQQQQQWRDEVGALQNRAAEGETRLREMQTAALHHEVLMAGRVQEQVDTLTNLQAQCDELHVANDGLAKQVQAGLARASSLEAQLASEAARVAALQQTHEEHVAALLQQGQDSAAARAGLQDTIGCLESQVSQLQQALDSATDSRAALQLQLEADLKSLLAEQVAGRALESRCKALEQATSEHLGQVQQLQAQAAAMETDRDAAVAALAAHEQTASSHRAQLETDLAALNETCSRLDQVGCFFHGSAYIFILFSFLGC